MLQTTAWHVCCVVGRRCGTRRSHGDPSSLAAQGQCTLVLMLYWASKLLRTDQAQGGQATRHGAARTTIRRRGASRGESRHTWARSVAQQQGRTRRHRGMWEASGVPKFAEGGELDSCSRMKSATTKRRVRAWSVRRRSHKFSFLSQTVCRNAPRSTAIL